MTAGYYNMLYLSNRNTTRSIFAEAVANGKGCGRFKGYSAGLNPASEVDPMALDILLAFGLPNGGLASQALERICRSGRSSLRLCIHSLRSRYW